MKKALFAAAALAAWVAFAAPVSTDEAAAAVANWLASGRAMGCTGMGDVADVQAFDATGGAGRFYVISLKNAEGAAAGYVVTSADRKLNPVLAYSESGTFAATDENPLWAMLGIDVSNATKALVDGERGAGMRLTAAAGGNANEAKWAELLGESTGGGKRLRSGNLSSVSDLRVNTLLETYWGQDGHGENYYTPKGYVCGCVATAMAQIMRYWRYPTQSITLNYPYNSDGSYVGPGSGTRSYEGEINGESGRWNAVDGYKNTSSSGYTAWSPAFGGTYDWSNMPGRGGTTATQKAAIGKLTRDCGISVHMDYGSDGSGAANYLVAKRLTDQFGYANALVWIHTDASGGSTLDEIKRTIIPSLNMKSPCGVSVPGHAIVADGYGYNDGTLYIHFNLGWSGSFNAWYAPPDLTDASSNFSSISAIIYSIYPQTICSESGRMIVSGRVLNPSGNPVSGVTVTAQNTSSGASYSAVAATDAKGIYAILVPAGSYKVCASADGGEASIDVTVEQGRSANVYDHATYASYTVSNGLGGYIRNQYDKDLTLVASVSDPLPAPTFAPKSGTVFFRDGQPVTLACATAGVQIRYTLDGSEPTEQSALYEGPILISASATVRARAFKMNMDPSEIASASYSRRAIIGESLVQDTAPAQGETQTLSVAAPGTYAASFSYAGIAGHYGESVELRLAKGGSTRTLASVAAASAGTFTTNFTFEVSEAGDYDLFVYNPRSGASQPVTISGLTIAIPATEASRYWIYETERTCGSTGAWSAGCEFRDGKMSFDGSGLGEFTPSAPQDGRRATITFTSTFDTLSGDKQFAGQTPKAAIHIATDETSGENTFSVLTSADGEPVWRNVRAAGAGEPSLGVPYTFKFVLDCTNGTYTAYLVDGGTELLLADGNVGTFAFASGRREPVEAVKFEGHGSVESLYGGYGAPSMFAAGDLLTLAGGAATTNITAGQAAWLNSMDAYDAVNGNVWMMGAGDFLDAWLLNLDITRNDSGLVAFKVSGIEVTATEVRITVKLERAGVIGEKINGILKLYGGTTPDGAQPRPANLLDVTPVTNADFGDGDTALFVYPRSGGAKFFRPAITW